MDTHYVCCSDRDHYLLDYPRYEVEDALYSSESDRASPYHKAYSQAYLHLF